MIRSKIAKTTGFIALVCLSIAGAQAVQLDVGLTDSHALGDVINGIQAGGQVNRDVLMVNNLLSVPLGTSQVISGENYQRSANVFSPLPTAVAGGAAMASGIVDGGNLLDIVLPQGFVYLVAAYDGPNGGVEIWDIADLAAGTTVSIPRYAEPATATGPLVASTRYLMTGWTLLNPTGGGVPDGGLTILMLGSALVALGAFKRRIG